MSTEVQHTPRASTSSKPAPPPARKRKPSPACCSEVEECTIVCCDSPDCVVTDSVGGDLGDGDGSCCAECVEAAEECCTEDCIVSSQVDDCPECIGEPDRGANGHLAKSENNQTAADPQGPHQVIQPLSASHALDTDGPIQSCDVPGCEAIEWDESAVDELLRCCCNSLSGDHHHQSFTTPSYASTSTHGLHQHQHPHNHSHSHHGHTHQSDHVPVSSALQPHTHVQHHQPFMQASHGSTRNEQLSGALSSGSQPVGHTFNSQIQADPLPGSQGHTGFLLNHGQFAMSEGYYAYAKQYGHDASLLVGHNRSQSMPVLPPLASSIELSSSAPIQSAVKTVFRCEWSACLATFSTREELVGHVNVTHLVEVKPTSEITPPTPAQSYTSAPHLPESRDGAILHGHAGHLAGQTTTYTDVQPKSLQEYLTHSTANATAFGLQNPPTDTSFDHTLRCLWDSCATTLPTMGPASQSALQPSTVNGLPTATVPFDQQPTSAHMPPPNGTLHQLSDQSTASLVRHLLQDHLHLPTDVLGQLASPMHQSSQWAGQAHNVLTEATQPALPVDMPGQDRLPSNQYSNYSTPSISAKISAHASPASFGHNQSPPEQPVSALVAAAQSLNESDFALPFSSYPSNDADDMHSCKWNGCWMRFNSTSELMDHISTAHIGSGKSMYYCEWDGCDRATEGRGFNQRQKIMRHLRTHVGDKPFVCDECGRAFSESTTLAQHIRTHTNEKPFVCPEPGCGKRFAIQSALTIHLRTHSGEKPFKCPHPGCDMAFAESSNLSKHVKTHLAKSAGLDSGSLTRARKRHHADVESLSDEANVYTKLVRT